MMEGAYTSVGVGARELTMPDSSRYSGVHTPLSSQRVPFVGWEQAMTWKRDRERMERRNENQSSRKRRKRQGGRNGKMIRRLGNTAVPQLRR